MDLYDVAVARKLSSGGGGGGGSSDFSMATMTMINEIGASIICAYATDNVMGQQMDSVWTMANTSGDYDVILYKGKNMAFDMDALGAGVQHTISVTGNAQVLAEVFVEITGDCTITIS